MPATRNETLELAKKVTKNEKDETVLLGTLYHFTFGHRTEAELNELKPLVEIAFRCLDSAVGHDPERMAAVRRVIARLRQAQQTFEVLQGLPD